MKRLNMKGLKWMGLLVGLPSVAIVLFYLWGISAAQDPQGYAAIVHYEIDNPSEGKVSTDNSYTVVSYNIGYLSGLSNNTAERLNPSDYAENLQNASTAIKEINPDIVAFQEVDFGSKRSYKVDQAEAIAQATELVSGATTVSWDKNYVPFPYWPLTAHFGKTLSGQAVLTRSVFSIQEHRRLVLERIGNSPLFSKAFHLSKLGQAFYLDKLAQVVKIDLQGQPVVVINVHLEAFVEETRKGQTQFVRSLAEDYARTHPVILLGDFNSALNRPMENNASIQILMDSDVLSSAEPPSNWENKPTYPSDYPQHKLDYIFYTPDTINVVETQVVEAAGKSSDHLPIAMQFQLK